MWLIRGWTRVDLPLVILVLVAQRQFSLLGSRLDELCEQLLPFQGGSALDSLALCFPQWNQNLYDSYELHEMHPVVAASGPSAFGFPKNCTKIASNMSRCFSKDDSNIKHALRPIDAYSEDSTHYGEVFAGAERNCQRVGQAMPCR